MFKRRCVKQIFGNLILMMTIFGVFYTKYCSKYNTAFKDLQWVLLLVLLVELVSIFIQIIRHE